MDHVPVLLAETLHFLNTDAFAEQSGVFVDATFGGGGHSAAILESAAAVQLLAIDRDETAAGRAAALTARFGSRFRFMRGNFAELPHLLAAAGLPLVDAILFDLGLSSYQLGELERGFSFRLDGPLDMRMDQSLTTTAAAIVNHAEPAELKRLLREYGEEPRAAKIARAIVARRAEKPFATTRELADLVVGLTPPAARNRRLHPATRVFQALRIAVNAELEALRRVLPAALASLRSGGRLVVIAYHSLEDRIVKKTFHEWAAPCICPPGLPVCACGRTPQVEILTRRPVVPGAAEVRTNPRSRSAKLRAVVKR
ncbi:MAG: 16S rRNA (cytosine(1402)-N(4))-methyltransferase RsmH [Deltaproteobacteria bacterium]|nr:16S rRNA (cytosine(1402)-N(4))-methyltransferase RsmH [Deltaproteobacteria bacterium]